MSLRSKIRDWIYPSREDSFDDSYGYLLEFFNSLDEEFGGILDFLFDEHVHKIFRTLTEVENFAGEDGQIGLYIRTGDLYKYSSSTNTWEIHGRLGRLPKIKQSDPTKEDIGLYDAGETWVNVKSGQTFKYIGQTLVSENPDIYEAIWVNQTGKIPYQSDTVKQLLFYPMVNFSYKTKTLSSLNGVLTFDDERLHIEQTIDADGVIQYFNHDTHVDLFIQDFLVGTLIINRKKVQSIIDIEFFNPEGGLPAQNDPDIGPWYEKFQRLLGILEISSKTNPALSKYLRTDMKFPSTIEEMMTDGTKYNEFFDINLHTMITEYDMTEMKERYRSFFAATSDNEMTIVEKSWAIYLLGVCDLMVAYDGNIYYIDGSIMLADGNIQPICI